MFRALPISCLVLLVASSASAQTTRSVKSTREAYGVRLDAEAQPDDVNNARVNSRLETRVNNRLSLRLERYRVGQTADPTATYRVRTDDGTRTAPVIAPPPQQPDDAAQQ